MDGVASLPLKCIASAARAIFASQAGGILILVLMEYGLRACRGRLRLGREVLILVLMEYGLRVLKHFNEKQHFGVLILVLMEYGLRDILFRY